MSTIVFLWWPFVIYSGWVTVASIANTSAYLTKIGWSGFGASGIFWTVLMIIIATAINLYVTWKRNMRTFALVGAWALIAIAVANKGVQELIVIIAFVSAGILIVSSTIHAIKNRVSHPLSQLVRSKSTGHPAEK
jgi:hypothetical protein